MGGGEGRGRGMGDGGWGRLCIYIGRGCCWEKQIGREEEGGERKRRGRLMSGCVGMCGGRGDERAGYRSSYTSCASPIVND